MGRPRIGGGAAEFAQRGARQLRALRVAPALCATIVVIAVVDGAVQHQVAPAVVARWASTATTLLTRPWRLLTSVLLTSGPRMTVGICLAFVGIAFAEVRVGPRTTLLAGAAGTVFGTVICDIVLLAAAAAGNVAASATARAPDFGASAVTVGALGAAAVTLGWPGRILVAVVALNGIVIHHTLADWEHVVAFGAGAATGTFAGELR